MLERLLFTLSEMDTAQGFFYHYYVITGDPHPSSYHDMPVFENTQLWNSLNVLEGWLLDRNYQSNRMLNFIERIKQKFFFAHSLKHVGKNEFMSLFVNADSGEPLNRPWTIECDDTALSAITGFTSDSIIFEEFEKLYSGLDHCPR